MKIVRSEPFRDLLATQGSFNQLFNETFSRFFGDGSLSVASNWVPSVDIHETDDNIVLKAELPGVDPEDVEVRVEGNTLYLRGERKLEQNVKDDNYVVLERAYGAFARSFALPSSIDVDKVNAEYKNGVLTLTMPKREEAKPKTIQILGSKN
jgi:HSP20 family protein